MFTPTDAMVCMKQTNQHEATNMTFTIRRKNVRNDWRLDNRNNTNDMAFIYARGVNSITR